METDLTNLDPFIQTAHTEVSELSYEEQRKTQIELWLAAHFVLLRERELDSKTNKDQKESYGWEKGKGYEATRYGQQALALDKGNELSSGADSPSSDVAFRHTG